MKSFQFPWMSQLLQIWVWINEHDYVSWIAQNWVTNVFIMPASTLQWSSKFRCSTFLPWYLSYTDRLLKQRVVLLANVYTQVMKVLLKLCQNIVKNPGNPKFRNLNSKKMDRITGKVGTFSQILRSLDFRVRNDAFMYSFM